MTSEIKERSPAVGIDLGTTYSVAAVYHFDRVEIIPNEQGNRTTPSIVSFNKEEQLIGETADDNMTMNPENTIYGEFWIKKYLKELKTDSIITNHFQMQSVLLVDPTTIQMFSTI